MSMSVRLIGSLIVGHGMQQLAYTVAAVQLGTEFGSAGGVLW